MPAPHRHDWENLLSMDATLTRGVSMLTYRMIAYVQQLMLYGRPSHQALIRLYRIEDYLLRRFAEMD